MKIYNRFVLIPSSSGQSFNATLAGANLFGAVLIPSSSGQSFNADLVGADLFCGLNPFFIRSIVQFLRQPHRCQPRRLNPFFIRSIVQWRSIDALDVAAVLIPSSSGQSFNSRRR